MMYTISKQFEFSASHVLEGLPPGHPCGRLHGHNYIAVIELQSHELDMHGFVRDYGDLKVVKEYLDTQFDHRHLNAVLGDVQPSAELLARHLYDHFKPIISELAAVRVSETPKTWAEYRDDLSD